MNKKGLIFFWAVFGIAVAAGMFFFFSINDIKISGEKGHWPIEFLEFQQETSNVKAHFDYNIKLLAWNNILVLAEYGGVRPDKQVCGNIDNYYLWNNKSTYCLPIEKELFNDLFDVTITTTKDDFFINNTLFQKRFYSYKTDMLTSNRKIMNISFTDIKYDNYLYDGTVFSGKSSESINFESNEGKMQYTTNPSFTVDLGYDLQKEYAQLETDALYLLNVCSGQLNLQNCLDKEKLTLSYWHYTDCKSESYSVSSRKVKFCVESPYNYQVYNLSGGAIPVEYNLALDFTPTRPFSIVDIEVDYDVVTDVYEITFDSNNLENEAGVKYKIYATDETSAETYYGSVEEFQNFYLLSGSDFQSQEISTININQDCPSNKFSGEAYLCSDGDEAKITYVYDNNLLTSGKDYYFAVTVEQNMDESDITQFVLSS